MNPEQPKDNPPKSPSLSDRQREIYRRLEHIDAGLGDRYLGIHWAIQSSSPDRWSQAANSARELIKELMRFKGGTTSKKFPRVVNARDSLRTAWGDLRARENIPPRAARDMTGRQIDQRLAKVLEKLEIFYVSLSAHKPTRTAQAKRALGPLRLVDIHLPSSVVDDDVSDLLDLWEFMEAATHHGRSNEDVEEMVERLDAFFARWVPETFSDLDELDSLLDHPDKLDRALEIVRQSRVNRIYFFESLEDPDWIGPLAESGFFTDLPNLVEEDGRFSYPGWPEGEYLLRMAEKATEKVAGIVSESTDTNNVRVRSILIQIALAMPDLPTRRGDLETEWLKGTDWTWLDYPDHLGALMLRLAEAGECKRALNLFRELMAVESNGETGALGARPVLKIEDWYFERICENVVPGLVDSCGEAAVNVLADLLEQFIAIQAGQDGREDYSTIWRPDIGSSRFLGRARDQQLDALREGVLKSIGADADRLRQAVETLIARPRNLFARLALFVLAQKADLDVALAMKFASDPEYAGDSEFQREIDLLRAAAVRANGGEVSEAIFARIDSDPDWPPPDSDDYTPEQREEIISRWRMERLAAISEFLPSDRQAQLDKLIGQFGPPDPARDRIEVATWGIESPLSADEVNEMDPAELIDYLGTWEPPTHYGPSRAGLARPFAARYEREPEVFKDQKDRLLALPAEYPRAILESIEKAIRAEEEVRPDWEIVLDIAESMLQKGAELPSGDLDVLANAAAVIELAFAKDLIPEELADRAWTAILESVDTTVDSLPSNAPSAESRNSGIVSPLAKVAQTVIAYAGWLKRRDGVEMSDVPEVLKVVERLLATDDRRLLHARDAFGARLGFFFWLDSEWFKDNVGFVFPDEASEFRDAIWVSFLRWSQPYIDMVEVLLDQYVRSVGELKPDPPVDDYDISTTLAQHLGSYYWWDGISLEEGGLLRNFIERAPDRSIQRLLEFLGHSLDESDLEGNLATRLCELWDAAIELLAARDAEVFKGVVSPFGWWWGSGKLDMAWSDDRLKALLSKGVKLDPEFRMFSQLATRSEEDPSTALELLRDYIRANPESWRLQSGRTEVRTILQRGLDSGNDGTVNAAKAVIDQLGALGHLDYRELLD